MVGHSPQILTSEERATHHTAIRRVGEAPFEIHGQNTSTEELLTGYSEGQVAK